MPYFRCVSCGLGCESLVLLGAGDCPVCAGDVVHDQRRTAPPARTVPAKADR